MVIMQFNGYPAGTKLSNVKTRFPVSECKSMHIPASVVQRNQSQNTDTKIWSIIRGLKGCGGKITNLISLQGGGYAEIIDIATGNRQVAMCTIPNSVDSPCDSFKVAECNSAKVFSPYDTTKRQGSVLLAAFIATYYSSDSEMQAIITELLSYSDYDENSVMWDDPISCERFGKLMCMLSSNIYYRIARDVKPTTLRQNDLVLISKKVKEVLFCAENNTLLNLSVAEASFDGEPLKCGEYSFSEKRVFTAEEKSKMLKPSDAYITPVWVRSVCRRIKDSSRFEQPFRNILLTGPSGTGKTTGAVAVAYGLGLPYVKITCGPDTDFFDLIGQMLPNTEKMDASDLYKTLNVPSFEDVENDFVGTYRRLFGKEPEKLSQPADCYTEILNRIMAGMQTSKDFTYVESDFLRAVENGWVVEIQEPTVIKRSSVLVGLNSILETDTSTASITLPTGKTIKRHPDTVIVMTTNSDYEGCGRIQQSVLSRMDVVLQIDNPSEKETVERTKAKTGFKETALLHKMAVIVKEINDFCKNHDIRDGVCGPRELKNWAQESILVQMSEDNTEYPSEASVITALFPTLLSKVSQSPEDVEDVITGVINKHFNQDKVQAAKESYLRGY